MGAVRSCCSPFSCLHGKPQGSPKPPEARLSKQRGTPCSVGAAALPLAGWLPVPTQYNVRDARAARHPIAFSAPSVLPPRDMSDAHPVFVLVRPLPPLSPRPAWSMIPSCKPASGFDQYYIFPVPVYASKMRRLQP